jgi:hypothetical protein
MLQNALTIAWLVVAIGGAIGIFVEAFDGLPPPSLMMTTTVPVPVMGSNAAW